MWRKASRCSAVNCLEADGPWVKAEASNPSGNCVQARWTAARACSTNSCVQASGWTSACSTQSCVEASHHHGTVWVRDSKLGDNSPVLAYPEADWDEGRVIDFIPAGGEYMVMGTTAEGMLATLFFNPDEVTAFRQGIDDRDFALADA